MFGMFCILITSTRLLINDVDVSSAWYHLLHKRMRAPFVSCEINLTTNNQHKTSFCNNSHSISLRFQTASPCILDIKHSIIIRLIAFPSSFRTPEFSLCSLLWNEKESLLMFVYEPRGVLLIFNLEMGKQGASLLRLSPSGPRKFTRKL